jgi:O-antigen biosynthesis protein
MISSESRQLPAITALTTDFVCGTFRFANPLRVMVEQGRCKGDVYSLFAQDRPLAINSGQIVLLQRERNLGDLFDKLRHAGCRIIYDIDDLLWCLPPDNVNVAAMSAQALEPMFSQMKRADCVTCSTDVLRSELEKIGISARVLPNALVASDWTSLKIARRARLKPRVGWYGQQLVHVGDIALLDGVVRSLINEVQWVFFGDIPASMNDLSDRIEFRSHVALQLFPATLAALDLDLVLSPLAQNRFNESKSNLRLLQAGILGYPVVATEIAAHSGVPVKLVQNSPQAWIEAIRERIVEPDYMRREGAELREFVLKHYTLDSLVPLFEQAWTGSRVAATAAAPGLEVAPGFQR